MLMFVLSFKEIFIFVEVDIILVESVEDEDNLFIFYNIVKFIFFLKISFKKSFDVGVLVDFK